MKFVVFSLSLLVSVSAFAEFPFPDYWPWGPSLQTMCTTVMQQEYGESTRDRLGIKEVPKFHFVAKASRFSVIRYVIHYNNSSTREMEAVVTFPYCQFVATQDVRGSYEYQPLNAR